MAKVAIGFGIVLILQGVVSYMLADAKSGTAFIPSGFGVVILVCGVLATKEAMRKHAMHLASAVGLLGLLGGFGMGIPKALKGTFGLSVQMQILMGAICLVFVGLCVQSFIAARKARELKGGGPADVEDGGE